LTLENALDYKLNINSMKFYKFSIPFLLFWFAPAMFLLAQDKQLTLEDANYSNRALFPKRMSQLMWMGETDDLCFVDGDSLIRSSALTDNRRPAVTLDELNGAFHDQGIDSIRRFPRVEFVSDVVIRVSHKNTLFSYDIITKNLEKLNTYPKEGKNIDVSDHSHAIAYTIDNNLFVAINGKQMQVTNDEDRAIVNGQAVHRVEFGIRKGTFWSPRGNRLAFYRKDESMVTNYPLVDITARIAEVDNTKYPMAGMPSHHVTLGIYDPALDNTVFMDTGEPAEQYLTAVTWDPSGDYIYIALLNRDQDHMKLNKYDARSGELVMTLFEESSEKYVEPEHPLYFLDAEPGYFIWFSERDGWQHMYLYTSEGELVKQLTQGEWVVTDYRGADKKGKTLYFNATKDSPIESNVYSLNINSGKIQRITPDHGTHSVMVSHSGKYFIDTYSSTEVAREYKVLDSKGKTLRILQGNKDPLADYKLGEMSIFTIKADDGSDLYCRMIKPSNFEEGRKYPVYFYVYGGPHSQLISDSWLGDAGIFQNYMAQQGYVVFTMDNRGTNNRGLAFEQATFRNLGEVEVADQMKGVEYLKSLDFVDPDRIGVNGWSYGGFMSISLMLRNPGVFRAACAGGPVIDWKYYEVMYGERYMDTPETNPEGYKNSSLLNYVHQLEGDLLVIHGTKDPTVVWQHSLAFVQKCVEEGKQLNYFVYPGHGHGVGGKDRLHLRTMIRDFFDEHLKP
jgi:dipeptidyl-peptidase-4